MPHRTTDKDTARMIRAQSMIEHGNTPEEARNGVFYVQSSKGGDNYYKVTYHKGQWTCDCPDYQNRHIYCKHIYAIHYSQHLKEQMVTTIEASEPIMKDTTPRCTCGSTNLIKNGSRKTKTGNRIRMLCKDCGKTFTVQPVGFERMQSTAQVITVALDLYFKSTSLRKITDHIDQFYNCEIHHTTILYWVEKFGRVISEYTEQFEPKVGGMWHADEMKVKTKRDQWTWLWHVIDGETRYMIANLITKKREVADARGVLHDARVHANDRPELLVTDGLQSYNDAFSQEIYTTRHDSEHVQSPGIRSKANNKIECLHNTVREREKVMRGFHSKTTAARFNSGFKAYYNHIRPHQALHGQTPAQAAGIDLHLDRNRWQSIIEKSVENG